MIQFELEAKDHNSRAGILENSTWYNPYTGFYAGWNTWNRQGLDPGRGS